MNGERFVKKGIILIGGGLNGFGMIAEGKPLYPGLITELQLLNGLWKKLSLFWLLKKSTERIGSIGIFDKGWGLGSNDGDGVVDGNR